jgi:Xaa-Pro dipeptidase
VLTPETVPPRAAMKDARDPDLLGGLGGGQPWDRLVALGELNQHALGPDDAQLANWAADGLTLPDLDAMARHRVDQLRQALRDHDCAGALLYDPINIRYATATTNMSLWTMHNDARYAFVAADGPVVMFEFSDTGFLATHSPVIDELRTARSFAPSASGDRAHHVARRWAVEVAELVDDHRRAGRRLAVDRLDLLGVRALEAAGLELVEGSHILEQARMIKGDDEIRAMRAAVHAAQQGVEEMRAIFEPEVSETALLGRLTDANLRGGGEWLETRLICSGPRTNPWYQEASSRHIADGDLLCFDTDLIGAYGMCVDLSRTWHCGDGPATDAQLEIHGLARQMLETNIDLHRAGASLREISEKAWYPSPDLYNLYSCISHGVGLCDEYPLISLREDWDAQGYDDVLLPGMTMCVEAFVGDRHGGEGAKLEQQILITETGPEILTDTPLDLTG